MISLNSSIALPVLVQLSPCHHRILEAVVDMVLNEDLLGLGSIGTLDGMQLLGQIKAGRCSCIIDRMLRKCPAAPAPEPV